MCTHITEIYIYEYISRLLPKPRITLHTLGMADRVCMYVNV